MYTEENLQMAAVPGSAFYERRKDTQCNSKTKLSPNDEFVEHTNDHTHPPS